MPGGIIYFWQFVSPNLSCLFCWVYIKYVAIYFSQRLYLLKWRVCFIRGHHAGLRAFLPFLNRLAFLFVFHYELILFITRSFCIYKYSSAVRILWFVFKIPTKYFTYFVIIYPKTHWPLQIFVYKQKRKKTFNQTITTQKGRGTNIRTFFLT